MTFNFEHHNLTRKLKVKSASRRRAGKAASAFGGDARLARNDIMPSLRLEEIAIKDISSEGRKTRKLDPAHIQETMTSIQTLGFCAPILIGKESEMIDGAVRVEACRRLGFERIPCIRLEHLSKGEQRVLRLAINRLSETGEWNLTELKLEFAELIVLDEPLEIAGFSLDEIDHVILDDDVTPPEAAALEPEAGAEPQAKFGDIYLLGPHRLICGDATDPAMIKALMGDSTQGSVRVVLTDEPYNVPIAGHVTHGEHREFAMASGEMTDEEFQSFNQKWMAACLPYVMDGGLLATFIDWRGIAHAHAAATDIGLKQLNLIVWSKTNGGMGSLYRSQHELLPIYKKGTAPHINNVNLGKRGRYRTNVWTYPGASSLGSDARKGLNFHPTVKPTAMLEDALLDITNRGDIVIDPFLGSGSTLIAAHRTGRICYGVELDPRYVDLIVHRYEKLTGEKAQLYREPTDSTVPPPTRAGLVSPEDSLPVL